MFNKRIKTTMPKHMTHAEIVDLHFPDREVGDNRELFLKAIDPSFYEYDPGRQEATRRFSGYVLDQEMIAEISERDIAI